MDPYQLLTKDEMTILKTYYTRDSDKGWTQDRKRVVAKLLDKLREHGFVIMGQYPSGSLRFAARRKSVLEMAMELPDKDFAAFQAGRLKFVDGQWMETQPCR
jgi:hypothetical protein